MLTHLTRVFASLQISSTDHVLGDGASVHRRAVTHLCVNYVHSHFHQILGNNACIEKSNKLAKFYNKALKYAKIVDEYITYEALH